MDTRIAADTIALIRRERTRRRSRLPDHPDAAYDQWLYWDTPFLNELCVMLVVAIHHRIERELIGVAAKATDDGKPLSRAQYDRRVRIERGNWTRIRDFRKLWRTACEDAGHPGKLFHDFRRSAVRTLERSGVPRSTAMGMVGHKTESIYRRYAIVDEAMHREAAAKLDAWAVDQKAKADAERKGQLRRFKKRQTA